MFPPDYGNALASYRASLSLQTIPEEPPPYPTAMFPPPTPMPALPPQWESSRPPGVPNSLSLPIQEETPYPTATFPQTRMPAPPPQWGSSRTPVGSPRSHSYLPWNSPFTPTDLSKSMVPQLFNLAGPVIQG